jgi:transposase-like protein
MKTKKEKKVYKTLYDLLVCFPTERDCVKHFEKLRWNGVVVSPFKAESKVYVCKGGKYKCKHTGKYFNVKTGTIFESSNISMQKWLMAIYMLTSHKKGISSYQLGKDIGVTQATGWFMLHRLRFAMSNKSFKKPLEGLVEADETYIGGKDKNKHRTEKERGQGNMGRAPGDNKQVVAGVIQREGEVRVEKIANARAENLEPVIFKHVKEGSKLMTDEWNGYRNIGRAYDHKRISHLLHVYVKGEIHTNTIENFWSVLKRGLYGIYHKCEKEHLQCYLEEFAFRFNSRKMGEFERMDLLLSNTEGRLLYKQFITGKPNQRAKA